MTLVPDDDRKLLGDFLSAYFHQDWDLDSETPAEVTALYIRDSTHDQINLLRSAILRLIDSDFDNAELERSLLRDFDCFYLPSGTGETVREWLRSIVRVLSENRQ
jgi:hypothetical protein